MESKTTIEAYYTGMVNGVTEYAWWKDGVQYVGTTGRILAEALKEIESRREKALKVIGRN